MTELLGFLVINKPKGITSHDCVQRIRNVTGLKKVGHGGTLDPAVTGVLPIAIGQATRLFNYLPGEKTYIGTIQLGIQTTTDDLEGDVIATSNLPKMDISFIESQLDAFRGSIEQVPPQFSSVHVNGQRAYQRARQGDFMKLASRRVTIYDLKVLHWDKEKGQLKIYVHCSSGTYIRSLAREFGESIGSHGALESLKRIQALGFNDSQAIELPAKSDKTDPEDIVNSLIRPIHALDHLEKRILQKEEIFLWRTGRSINKSPKLITKASEEIIYKSKAIEDSIVVISENNVFEGIGLYLNDEFIKPKVVFNAI